jgi:hypothetical protein
MSDSDSNNASVLPADILTSARESAPDSRNYDYIATQQSIENKLKAVFHLLVIRSKRACGCGSHTVGCEVIAAACFVVVTVERAMPGRVGGEGYIRAFVEPLKKGQKPLYHR